MITTFNNRNVGQMKHFRCPTCQRPMKGSSELNHKRFYFCKLCQEKHTRDPNFLIIDVDIYQKDKEVWISVMDLYFDNLTVRQYNMENESEHASTTIYHIPEDVSGTWVEIASFPMIEFDITDPIKFKKKIKTYVTFS